MKKIVEKSKQIETLEKNIKESEEQNNVISFVKEVETKFETFEKNLQTMKICLQEKDKYISELEVKIKLVEENFSKAINDRVEKLEKLNEEHILKLNLLQNKIPASPSNESINSKCSKCDFQTGSDHGMKVHMTRKHTHTNVVKYPKKCDLCEKQFGNATEFKQHMKTHSYKEAKFKCEDCDFVGKSKETMEVHIG